MSEIRFCDKDVVRSTVTINEIDKLISFFKAKYINENTGFPDIDLNDNNVCYYFPASGVHIIYPNENEVLYSSQIYVLMNEQKYRYIFRFAILDVNAEKLKDIKNMGILFEGRKMSQYYISRINDEMNTNYFELIDKKIDNSGRGNY